MRRGLFKGGRVWMDGRGLGCLGGRVIDGWDLDVE